MEIAIAGTSYVGSSNAIPPAHFEVVALDIVPETIVMRDRDASPIGDTEFIVIAVSANCGTVTNFFRIGPVRASANPGHCETYQDQRHFHRDVRAHCAR